MGHQRIGGIRPQLTTAVRDTGLEHYPRLSSLHAKAALRYTAVAW